MGKVRTTIPSRLATVALLGPRLRQLRERYDGRWLETDPLKFPHRFKNKADQEVVAFLSALLAFGNVKGIFRSIEALLNSLGPEPSLTVKNWTPQQESLLRNWQHRWVSGRDVSSLLLVLKRIYSSYESLEHCFLRGLNTESNGIEDGLNTFSKELIHRVPTRNRTRGFRYLLASPSGGSVCKRMNLFLRWMVRKKAPDLGLWTRISPKDLFLPLDTHLARIVRYLGLTRRSTNNWKTVVEVTKELQKLDSKDPISFDFALARLGILKECRHRPDSELCPKCPLADVCALNKGRFLKAA